MKKRIRKCVVAAAVAFALYAVVSPAFIMLLVRDVMASRRLRNDRGIPEKFEVELGRKGFVLTWYSPRCWVDTFGKKPPNRIEECAATVPSFGETVSVSVTHYVNPDHYIRPEVRPQIGRHDAEYTNDPKVALESTSPVWQKSRSLLNDCRLSYATSNPTMPLPKALLSYQ